MGLRFERIEQELGGTKWTEWRGNGRAWARRIMSTQYGIRVDGFRLDSPADLAELRRVLDAAEEVAGWKGVDNGTVV